MKSPRRNLSGLMKISRTGSANLAYFNMIAADPELYDPWDVWRRTTNGRSARLANSPVSLSDTERASRNNVALGAGPSESVGLRL